MPKKIEIIVAEHDFAMLELLLDEVEPWEEEGAALLRVLNQIVAKNDTDRKS